MNPDPNEVNKPIEESKNENSELSPTSTAITAITKPQQIAVSSGARDFSQFLSALNEYTPTFPENLTRYYMERAGFSVKDERILKLVSLAADKVMSEIIYEAKQVSTLKQYGHKNAKRKAEALADTLDIDDVEASLSQFRVYIRKKKRKGDA